tara:strand:+ start:317 stop:508 length:192 start_codon:yes stop_codon:yes gene_type:complete
MSTEEKVLQIVNLAPSESALERLVDMHPMRQIAWASVIQLCVFGFMILSFWIIQSVIDSGITL